MTTTLISGGHIIDPAQNIDQPANLLISNGLVVGLSEGNSVADNVIDATGRIVCPGFIDTHVALREPGYEEDETTETATAAALAGGYTSIAAMPDTLPVVDNQAAAEFIILQAKRARKCHVFPLGAVTAEHAGKELAEIGQLVEGGALAFTDGKRPLANAEVMRRALEYTRMFNKPIFNFPTVPELAAGGVMHEGFFSTQLGLQGIPAAAQDIMVARDIALAEMTGGLIHLMCLSTTGSVDLVRSAKQRGVRVTGEVTPHHLSFTDEELTSFDPNFKVAPPLRTQDHIDSLIEGLKDGTIDVIASDHQPYSNEKKCGEIDLSPPGIVGLETTLPVCIRTLIDANHLSWTQLIAALTAGPANVLGIDRGTLCPGVQADITIFDPNAEWTIDANLFKSKSRNTPFHGWKVKGQVTTVIVKGEVRYEKQMR
jgi:dihydroorotase